MAQENVDMGVAEQANASDAASVDTPRDVQESSASAKEWAARIERCKKIRREMTKGWSDNVDYRRGKPFTENDDEDRVNVNLDWAYSKAKHAQLFSQVPQVYLTPKTKQFEAAVPVFQKQLNDTLGEANVGDAVDECVWDAINASGVGVAIVGYEALTENKVMPKQDISHLPPEHQQAILSGQVQIPEIQVDTVPQKISDRYYVTRISPSEFLWPVEFTGSNFDHADWLGRTARVTWDAAMRMFPVLKPEEKTTILQDRKYDDNLRRSSADEYGQEPMVEYDELFYWAHRFDVAEKQFKKIKRIVFVKGRKDPVVHEDWNGQQYIGDRYVGSCKFPIRVLTLTYISDDAIPPSDTAIGRPQIEEMIRSRTQIVLNRDRSQPLRWADINRVDPQILDTIQRGEFQSIIPVQGDGSRVLGEVARAAYPSEDFAFDRVIKEDLQEQWQIGPNQMGLPNSGRRTAEEARVQQSNTTSRIGYERGKVSAFFTGIAEVMGGLLSINGDFPILSDEEMQRLGTWNRKAIGAEFVYWIRPDSTVLLDSNERVDKLMHVLNLVGKSGFVNPKPLITEIVELHGIDPADVIVDPKPQDPPPPNLSYRFTGVQDLTNPLVVALLMKAGQAPSPEELSAAKKLLAAVDAIEPPEQPQSMQAGPGGPPQGPPPANPPADARPNWGGMPKVMKREADR